MILFWIIYGIIGVIVCSYILYKDAEAMDMGLAIATPWFWIIAIIQTSIWPLILIEFIYRKIKGHE